MAEAGAGAGAWVRRAEGFAYWTVIAPLAAWLPARLAYRVACWRGDWTPVLAGEARRDHRRPAPGAGWSTERPLAQEPKRPVQDGPSPAASAGLQVLPPADLDQPPHRPGPVPQPLHVEPPGQEQQPEPLPGHLLRRRRAQLVSEHQPQVASQLGAPRPAPESQSARQHATR